jgi:hypothetical protein
MSEFDALEKELAEMRPRQPSSGLKSRIAGQLEPSTERLIRTTPRRVRIRVAMIGGLAAAGLAAILFWWGRVPRIRSDPPISPDELLLATPLDPYAPSVWSYRSALARSPVSVESLLDRHSIEGRAGKSVDMNINAFARFDSDLNDSFGEL